MMTQITPPRVAFLDPRTGAVSREWYLFFLSLYNLTGAGTSVVSLEDIQRSPVSPLESVEAALGVLAQYAETLPPGVPVESVEAALPPVIEALPYQDTAPRYEAYPPVAITSLDQSVAVTPVGTIAADTIGFRGLPQNAQTTAYTLALADQGKHVFATGAAFTITVPANATTAFPVGSEITIFVGDAVKTLAPAAGVTLILGGTAITGSRTLAINSVATCIKLQTNVWVVSGAGVT